MGHPAQKTMIRSLETVCTNNATNGKNPNLNTNFFKTNPYDDTFVGWTPDVQMLTENDLKKIEKQEERESRVKRRQKR